MSGDILEGIGAVLFYPVKAQQVSTRIVSIQRLSHTKEDYLELPQGGLLLFSLLSHWHCRKS